MGPVEARPPAGVEVRAGRREAKVGVRPAALVAVDHAVGPALRAGAALATAPRLPGAAAPRRTDAAVSGPPPVVVAAVRRAPVAMPETR